LLAGSVRIAERGLVEDELQGLAAGGRAAQVVHLAGLLQHGGQAGGRGELVGGGEASEISRTASGDPKKG
jgi:hypothetical protein